MKVNFNIDKAKVFEEVAKSTAYVGALNDAYEKVSTVDANEEILSSFAEVAINDILCALGAYNPVADGLSIEVEMPQEYDTAKSEIITRLIFEYIVSVVIWKWLYLMFPEKAVMWEQKAAEAMQRMKSNINTATGARLGRRPMRPF
jgi:hypothetical protein